jgi:hypothetical protein
MRSKVQDRDVALAPLDIRRDMKAVSANPDFKHCFDFVCRKAKLDGSHHDAPLHKVTMAAGRLWSVEDLVGLWEAYVQRRAERAA